MKKHLNRRTFIKHTSLGAMAYKTLGRTGFEVTDIAAGYPSGESVLWEWKP